VYIKSMAITADDRYLFTSDSWNGTVKQFRVSDGRMIKDHGQLFHDGIRKKFISPGGIKSMVTTPDSKYLFAASVRGQLKQMCIESQEVVHDYGKIHGSHISCLQTTRDSKYLITGG
jgi:hypothetical protein